MDPAVVLLTVRLSLAPKVKSSMTSTSTKSDIELSAVTFRICKQLVDLSPEQEHISRDHKKDEVL